MIQFYAPDIESDPTLPEGESAHCCRVLRLREGDEAWVVDGQGHRFRTVVTEAHQRHTSVNIVERIDVPNHWRERIVLAVAPTKNMDRIEWLVEKAVEVGVDEIVLLECRHSERRKVNLQRLEAIVVSAMKQSLKGVKPRLRGMVRYADFVEECDTSQRLMCYCDEATERRLLARTYRPGSDVTVLIGPEGDFSPEEAALARERGFVATTLGESRLRTETAALVALTAIHVLDQQAPSAGS